jgi:hypothetical protein
MSDIFVRGIRGSDKFVVAGHNGAFQKRLPFSRDKKRATLQRPERS